MFTDAILELKDLAFAPNIVTHIPPPEMFSNPALPTRSPGKGEGPPIKARGIKFEGSPGESMQSKGTALGVMDCPYQQASIPLG